MFFTIDDDHLSYDKNKMVNLKDYPHWIRNDIIDTLNENFNHLVIVEKPIEKRIIFLLKGKIYFEKYEKNNEYITKLDKSIFN